ncbi:unnamed protein product [Alopecurus aequalis]
MWRSSVLGELVFGHPVEDEDEDEERRPNDDDDDYKLYGPRCGGIHTMPPGYEDDPEAVALARFAVAEHNKNTNAVVEFERLVKVRRQGVAGLLHYFTIEAKEGEASKLYKAIVYERVWENYTGLRDFKPVGSTTLYERIRYLYTYQLPAWREG